MVDDFSARGFCEANSAIYSHYVPHDLPGLMELFGGRQAYLDSLNGSFERAAEDWLKSADKVHAANWVDYGNQPGTGMAHLFNVAGAPWLSQKWVRAIKDTYADTTAYGGYHGDEDQGQMGALGVLLATGLFSVDGSTAVEPSYEITTPVFGRWSFTFTRTTTCGERFTIRTVGRAGEGSVHSVGYAKWPSMVIGAPAVCEGSGRRRTGIGNWGATRIPSGESIEERKLKSVPKYRVLQHGKSTG